MSRILIVGPATGALKKYLTEHGYDYIRLNDYKQVKDPERRFKRRHVTDFSDTSTYLAAVDEIHQKDPIIGVMTTYENSVLPAAVISQHLGLAGLPIEAAEACTDKFLMRQKFATAPRSISPDYKVVASEEDVKDFASTHSFPLILKPANLAKSLLVTKSNNMEELVANYRHTMDHIDKIYQRYAPHRQPKLLVEEFLEGSIHSVDAFIDEQGEPHVLDAVVDYQTGYDVGFDDSFHYSRLLPSQLSLEQQTALKEVAVLGCRALGMKSSPAHIEIIMTTGGPKIVEIGARNGGYRERMHRLANGIDILGCALTVAIGKMPGITAARHDPCAVLELFPKKAGSFSGIKAEAEARALPSFVQLNVKMQPGQAAGKAADGFKMCAMIMLHNADTQQFTKDLAFVNQNVEAQTN